jgi:hypothetical protein
LEKGCEEDWELSNYLGMLGFKMIVVPVPTITKQAKRHQRKSSRRWQKKWLKKFGTVTIIDPKVNLDSMMIDQSRGIVYAYPHQVGLLRSMAETQVKGPDWNREWKQGHNWEL